jgi:hypothetical protein
VRTGDLASRAIVPTAKSAGSTAGLKPWLPNGGAGGIHVLRHVAGPTKKASPYFDGKS